MAVTGTKISELQELQQIAGNEYIPVVDGTTNKKVKTDKIARKSDIPDVSGFAAKVTEVAGSTGEVTQEINPNTFYKFGECTALNITLGAKVDGIYNEYMFQFQSGDTPTLLGEIAGVSWVGDNTIKANTTYVVVIHDGILAVLGGA